MSPTAPSEARFSTYPRHQARVLYAAGGTDTSAASLRLRRPISGAQLRGRVAKLIVAVQLPKRSRSGYDFVTNFQSWLQLVGCERAKVYVACSWVRERRCTGVPW